LYWLIVDRLHLRGDLGTDPGEGAAGHRKAAVGAVFERGDRRQEDLQAVDVARVRHAEVCVVLGEGVDHRVQLALLFALVFPVGVHGQAERVFPLAPVFDLDAFEVAQREYLGLRLVRKIPGQVAGHGGVLVLQTHFLGLGHDCLL
jgi:hypothetical protein